MRVLIIDLNNFSRYPTMSVGYMTAILRDSGHSVKVLSPLSVGVKSYPRVTRPGPFGFVKEWAKYRTGTVTSAKMRSLRQKIVERLRPTNDTARARTLDAVREALTEPFDVILLSSYTMYFHICVDISVLASKYDIPVIVGGPLFNHRIVAEKWLEIDGITGVFGGEPEQHISELVSEVGLKRSGIAIPGYSTRERFESPAAPLVDLDAVPFPDYSDFPWSKYPNRIIPMMTGRGCGWGLCTFCSDVFTAAGRTFRSRSIKNVLEEMKWQAERHSTTLFTFLDLKLNSNLDVWRGLADRVQSEVPGAEWTASLHVNAKRDNGLSAKEFKRARKAGLLRMTTGLESGSQRVLNSMAKGTTPESLSQAVRYAAEAGISVRLTVIAGYPGENHDDVRATKKFLDDHFDYVDRVVVNRFSLQLGTPAERAVLNSEHRMSSIENYSLLTDSGTYDMNNRNFEHPAHRREMAGLLMSAHRINRKPLSHISKTFEGVM